MRISVELVPRDQDSLSHELEALHTNFPDIDTVNIPDILRFKLRSWEACACAKRYVKHAIPHLRAIDIDLKKPLPMADKIEQHELRELLVIAGDAPADMSHTVYESTSPQVIRKILREFPGITVYAALDPYRQSFVKERDYALEKLEAGAAGLFTQPFFDVRLMSIYAELLPDAEIFWGITTVTSKRSLGYWQNRNKAIFPPDFTPNRAWNQALAKAALAFAKEQGGNIYFMPIRTDVISYLQAVFDPEEAP